MSENDFKPLPPDDLNAPSARPPQGSAPNLPVAPGAPVPPRKRRRRWPWVLLGIVVVLLVLVLLIPTIASMGFVRSIVLGRINSNLNGNVQIASWSLGWGGNVSVDGIRVVDADGRQILQLPHVTAHLAPFAALRGKYYFNGVIVDGLDFYAVRETDGTLNFSRLSKPSTKSPAERPAPPDNKTPQKAEPTKLPDLRGDVTLKNCRGTFEDLQKKQTLHLSSLEARVKIPDINSAIEDSLAAVCETGSGAAGKITVDGKLLLIKNNTLMTDPGQVLREGDVDQKILLQGLELASVAPFLGPDTGIDHLQGMTNGELDLKLTPGHGAGLSAMLRSNNVQVSGPALKGDNFAARTFEVMARQIVIDMPSASSDFNAARIRTGPTDGSGPITVTLAQDAASQSKLTLFLDVTPGSMSRLAANKSPGDAGRIESTADVNVGRLASSLPHLFNLAQGVQLKSGRLVNTLQIELQADKMLPSEHLLLSEVAGRDTIKNTDVALQPIDLTLQASDLGGGGALPDLRDLKMSLTSGFASASAQAANLGDLRAQLKGTFEQMQKELGQVIDFGDTQLAGSFEVNVSSKGDLVATPAAASSQPASAALAAQVALKGVKLSGTRFSSPVEEPSFALDLSAQLRRGVHAVVDQIDQLALTAKGSTLTANVSDTQFQLSSDDGTEARAVPLLDMLRKANVAVDIPSVAKFMSLVNAFSPPARPETPATAPAADSKTAAATPPKPKANLTSGSARFTLAASRENNQLILVPALTTQDLNVQAGDQSQAMGPLDLKTRVAITPQPAPATAPAASAAVAAGPTTAPPMMDQIAQLQISDLLVHAAGAEITLKQPLVLTDLAHLSRLLPSTQPAAQPSGGTPAVDAALLVKGDLVPAERLMETLDGAKPGSEYPYTGTYQFDQGIATTNGGLALRGQGDVVNFAIMDGQAVRFAEPDIRINNDVALPASAKDLNITALSVAMLGSKALNLSMKGQVADLNHQRQLNGLTADLTYDLAVLRKIVYPILSKSNQEQIRDIEATGQFTRHFVLSGSYPAGLPFYQAIRNVSGQGGLTVATVKGRGIDLQNLDVPVLIRQGKLTIANSDKTGDFPAPAAMNGGQFAIIGAMLDLGQEHPLLTMIPGTNVFRDVGLNPALASLLGEKVGNFLFIGADKTTGLLTVILEKCDRVPLDATLTQNVPSNEGVLAMRVSIKDLSLGGGQFGNVLGKVAGALGGGVNTNSLKGSLDNYRISLVHGVTTHDMTIAYGERQVPLHLAGTVNMQSNAMDMTLNLPLAMFNLNSQLASVFPNGFAVPVTGTVTAPSLNPAAVVQKNLIPTNNPQDLLQRLPGLIGGNKSAPAGGGSNAVPSGGSPPAASPDNTPADQNPVGALEDLFKKKDKKKKDKPKPPPP